VKEESVLGHKQKLSDLSIICVNFAIAFVAVETFFCYTRCYIMTIVNCIE